MTKMSLDLYPRLPIPDRPHVYEHLYEVAKHDPTVRTAMVLVERGELSREEALVSMVLALYASKAAIWKQHIDLVDVTPMSPFVIPGKVE